MTSLGELVTCGSCSVLFPQVALEEVGAAAEDLQPVLVAEEAVDLVGEDEEFVLDTQFPQLLHQLDGLVEGDVPVVVPVDEQHRRAPAVHRREW